jgi:tetratricopeptide (TPR) repeat protein
MAAYTFRDWSDSETQFRAAINAYTRAIELRPEDSDLWYERSLLHFRLGDFVAGAADLEKSLHFDRDTVRYLIAALGRYKLESKLSPEYKAKALDVLERLTAVAGENLSAHLALARAYLHPLRDREKSLKHFNRAAELSPNSARVLTARGEMHQGFGDHEEALNDVNHALELDALFSHA